ncbi:uncharacterized protein LOC133178649 [Saccostrea echinata]|uniref:uncharacterized protein LOC133178649 n=1 Tax=Saccostrea echinata TaxID=191078 RepID=UPI002A82863E|nr:uncharacterized protein LOC133178649 [Saccostrea echinata]
MVVIVAYLQLSSLSERPEKISEVRGRKCLASLPTINYIKHCPKTREEWINAEKIKGCDNIKQNCISKEKFKYHCVINSFGNATLDVCAPTWYISGFCTEFNEEGLLIQDHYAKDCTSFDIPCPTRYLSTDAYKYQGCYGVDVKTTENHSEKITYLVIGETAMGIFVGILFATLIGCIIFRNRKNICVNIGIDEQIQEDDTTNERSVPEHQEDDIRFYQNTTNGRNEMEQGEENRRGECMNTRLIKENRQRSNSPVQDGYIQDLLSEGQEIHRYCPDEESESENNVSMENHSMAQPSQIGDHDYQDAISCPNPNSRLQLCNEEEEGKIYESYGKNT